MALGNEITVNINANAKKMQAGLSQATRGLKGFAKKTGQFISSHKLLITGALVGIGAGLAKSIQLYGVQEKAIVTLTQALKNQGVTSNEAVQDQIDFAAAMQQVTAYGDEEVIQLQALLAQYGATGEELKNATKLTMDLAAAKGIELKAAADLVGKAFVGETGTLSRYGIIIEQGIPRTEKFAAVTKKMNAMFGGQAQAQRKTTLGQFKSLQNRIGDLQEAIGKELLPVFKSWSGWLDKVIKGMEMIAGATGENLSVQELAIEQQRKLIEGLQFRLRMLGKIGMSMSETAQKTRDEIALRVRLISASKEQIRVADNLSDTTSEAADERIERIKLVTSQDLISSDERMQQAMKEGHAKNVETGASYDFAVTAAQQWSDFAKSTVDNVISSFGDGMADMILESRRFSDVIKGIWKSLRSAVISMIAQMIARWLVFQALTGGGAGAGLMRIFGFQHGGIIGEPSIIRGLRSGKTALAGEAGPEVVVPAKSGVSGAGGLQQTPPGMAAGLAAGGGGGGGGNITINISGQFLEANPSAWGKLFREKIMPEIRRSTMITPTGPFNRKRGAA